MSEFWTWGWFPVNMVIGVLAVIVLLGGIWLIIAFIKGIIDEIFD